MSNPFDHWKLPEVAKENDEMNHGYFLDGSVETYPYYYKLKDAVNTVLSGANAPLKCLDVGCGTGWQGKYLSIHFPDSIKYEGLDISSHMCDRAKNNCPNGNFYVADVLEFEPKDKWDIVMACGSMEHFRDWRGFIKKLSDLSNQWVIIHKVFFTDKETNVYTRTMYNNLIEIRVTTNYNDFTEEVNKLGFEVVQRYDWEGGISGAILRKK
jgi:trans-aconitate methyltransferase